MSCPTSPIRPARRCRSAARKRLLDLAAELDIPVMEDTAYAALRFEGEPMPSLQSLDVARTGSIDATRVIYCGTFSKTLTPGLRTGWICAGRAMIRRLVLIKQMSDLNSADHQPDGHAPPGLSRYTRRKSRRRARTIAAAATPCWPRSSATCPPA